MSLSLAALGAVLGTSLGWAGLDLLRKVLAGRMEPAPLVVWLTLGETPFFLLWTWWDGRWAVDPHYLLPAAMVVAVHVAANVAFMRALQIAPLSGTIPMLSFTPVFSAGLSAFFLGEIPSGRQGAGILLVVLGAWVLHRDGSTRLIPRLERGPRLMLGVALLWALATVVDKRCLDYASPPLHGAIETAGVGLALLVFLTRRRKLRALRVTPGLAWPLAAAVLTASLALALQLLALQLVFVSIIEAAKRTIGMLFSIINGRLFFGEPLQWAKGMGVALLCLGVTLALF